ncbi:MAG: hypothetical protein GKC04_09125, partial [Methanomicrobiales archaeon]|nr:hypothetical protein [Methanomicrobiales archaeon]
MQEETQKRLKRVGTAVFIIFFCFIAGGLTLIFEYPELADPILPVFAENRTAGDGGIMNVPKTPVIPPTTVPTPTPGPGPGPNPVTGTEIVLLLAGPPTLPVGSPYSVAALVTNATSGAAIPGRTVLLS